MNHTLARAQAVVAWLRYHRHPIVRQLAALDRDRATGIARKVARLNRALREADAPEIQRHQQVITDYLRVVEGSSGVVAEIAHKQLPSPAPAAPPAPTVPQLPPPPAATTPVYWVSSTVLAEAHGYLTQPVPAVDSAPEWMLAVSGLRPEGARFTLEQLIAVDLDLQTPGNASFNMQDFARIAITLSQHGQALHAIFHSHRLRGPQSPSATDWRLQARLDQAGYPAIQAVFSEDGYVRFFARKPFHVAVIGKGVETIHADQKLYRITHFGTLPNPRRRRGQ